VNPSKPLATPEEYAAALEALKRRVEADPAAAALAREFERILRYESAHGLADASDLASRLSAPAVPRSRRTAVISDIHGNHDGLLAVLEDIQRQGCERIVCLGDLIEGGPDNEGVIDTLRRLGVASVRGNHDEWNDVELPQEMRRYLLGLPEVIVEEGVVYTHISPRARRRTINHAVEAWNVFDESAFRLLFVGHVHVPMIFGRRCDAYGEARAHAFDYNRPVPLDPGDQYIVSVGSIGYGRDLVGKLRYAIHDSGSQTIELRAIEGPLLQLDYSRR